MDLAAIGMDLGLVAGIGGALSLDRRAAFQLMLSQPLVAVPLLGLVFGDVSTGLWLGALLQLLWMSSAMFGANVPPHETVASVVIGGGVLIAGEHGPVPDVVACTIAVLVGVPFAYIGRHLEVWLDHRNRGLAEQADVAPERIGRLVLSALGKTFIGNALVIAAGTAVVAGAVAWIAPGLVGPPRVALAAVGVYGIPALALAVALTGVARRRGWVLAAATFVMLVAAMGGQT